MADPFPSRKRSLVQWVVLLSLLAVPVLFAVSIGRFLHTYRLYHDRAVLGTAQLTAPRIEREAIVVLTGDYGRIPKALALLQQRGSALLVISGTAKGISLTDLVNQQEGAIFHIKETWEKIVLESESSSTIENAEQTAPILHRRGIRRILLVTSDYHMGRSLRIFHRVMPELEILDYSVTGNTRKLEVSWKVWVEYWKTFVYYYVTSHLIEPYQPPKLAH